MLHCTLTPATPAASAAPAHSAPASPATPALHLVGVGPAHLVDLLLGHGLLDVDPLAADLVVALLDRLVHRVVVVELDEAEPLLLAGVAFSQPES